MEKSWNQRCFCNNFAKMHKNWCWKHISDITLTAAVVTSFFLFAILLLIHKIDSTLRRNRCTFLVSIYWHLFDGFFFAFNVIAFFLLHETWWWSPFRYHFNKCIAMSACWRDSISSSSAPFLLHRTKIEHERERMTKRASSLLLQLHWLLKWNCKSIYLSGHRAATF